MTFGKELDSVSGFYAGMRIAHSGLVTALLFLLITMGCKPQWAVLETDPRCEMGGFSDMVFLDRYTGFATTVADFQRTTDGGRNWETVVELDFSGKGPCRSITAVAVPDRKTVWAAGGLLNTDTTPDDPDYEINRVERALVLRSTDMGKTWTDCSPDVVADLRAIHFTSEAAGWAAGDYSILKTTDAGISWKQVHNSWDLEIGGVFGLDGNRALAVGQGGLILRTEDGGRSWNRQRSGTDAVLFRVRFFAGTGWVLGFDDKVATILTTKDQGRTWTKVTLPRSYRAVFDVFISGSRGWMVGTDGLILTTSDGGASWTELPQLVTCDLGCLFCLDSSTCWAGGLGETLLALE